MDRYPVGMCENNTVIGNPFIAGALGVVASFFELYVSD
jgi:hypothetical protein